MMFKRTLVLMLVAMAALVTMTTITHAQVAVRQQWEYALVTADLSKGDYQLVTSSLYEEFDGIRLARETTRDLWDALGEIEGAALVDYLAVMGISGFELVGTQEFGVGTTVVYLFKRPFEMGE